MPTHDVKTKADLLRLIDRAADEGWVELDLVGLGLEELPPAIGKLQALQTLSLADNQLTEIPDAIANLQALQTLDCQSFSNLKQTSSMKFNALRATKWLMFVA